MRVEYAANVIESAERETAPVVESAHDVGPVARRERAGEATHACEDGATSSTNASGWGVSAASRSRPATTCASLTAVVPVLTSGESALFGVTSVS